MTRRMLIDGTHPEETRVVVMSGHRLEEYDIETSTKKQIKGNIYLAKVTRVEPSLQAAFVDYGGNRHGFLAFNEIHPDYYQVPIEDRAALRAEHAEMEARAWAAKAHVDDIDGDLTEVDEPNGRSDDGGEDDNGAESDGREAGASRASEESDSSHYGDPFDLEPMRDQAGVRGEDDSSIAEDGAALATTQPTIAGEPAQPRKSHRRLRHYRIQEVIKRRQIILVQVVKEERGNKGAALTTYLSLAGRYCVLMPNTARGGGISRKINNTVARRKLKDILNELEIAEGMAVIIRTAGMERNRTEIKRDFEYLMRAWEEIRELTLKSTAPALVYEEANLIRRAIRDLYGKDIEEIYVEGADAYAQAKGFMRMLMPSHAKRVQHYRDIMLPLFHRFQVEGQLDAMYSPVVQLKAGGYIVIHSTEALVAIDVNSGRATRERNIEETALHTNQEAADEVGLQLRLRDLAGLIVVDFIDMEDSRNVRAVEKRFKDAVRTDRARIQLGRISNFGLMELSRQRLRPSLLETSTLPCPHCHGTGHVRSIESSAVRVLRAIEEEGIRRRAAEIGIAVPPAVALYMLNQKRPTLVDIEARYDFKVTVQSTPELVPPDYRIDRLRARPEGEDEPAGAAARDFMPPLPIPIIEPDGIVDEEEEEEAAMEAAETARERQPQPQAQQPREPQQPQLTQQPQGEGRGRKRRRRRRGRGGEDRPAPGGEAQPSIHFAHPVAADSTPEIDPAEIVTHNDRQDDQPLDRPDTVRGDEEGDAAHARRRRRGRRGGRRRGRRDGERPAQNAETTQWPSGSEPVAEIAPHEPPHFIAPPPENAYPQTMPIERMTPEMPRPMDSPRLSAHEPAAPAPIYAARVERPAEPKTRAEGPPMPDDPAGPKRRGWWQRLIE